LESTVPGAQFRQGATVGIAHPNVRAIEGEKLRTIADWEALDKI